MQSSSSVGKLSANLIRKPSSRRLAPILARELGVGRSTLHRWWRDGLVTPALVTAGGHARGEVDDLRDQLRALRKRDE